MHVPQNLDWSQFLVVLFPMTLESNMTGIDETIMLSMLPGCLLFHLQGDRHMNIYILSMEVYNNRFRWLENPLLKVIFTFHIKGYSVYGCGSDVGDCPREILGWKEGPVVSCQTMSHADLLSWEKKKEDMTLTNTWNNISAHRWRGGGGGGGGGSGGRLTILDCTQLSGTCTAA